MLQTSRPHTLRQGSGGGSLPSTAARESQSPAEPPAASPGARPHWDGGRSPGDGRAPAPPVATLYFDFIARLPDVLCDA